MEGEVLRLEKIHKPWVPRGVGVESFTGSMKDTKGTFLDKGTDGFPLVRGNMGKVATPAILESRCKREVEYANGAGLGRVMAVVVVLGRSAQRMPWILYPPWPGVHAFGGPGHTPGIECPFSGSSQCTCRRSNGLRPVACSLWQVAFWW